MTPKGLLRSVLAIVVGIVVISMVVEALVFGLVTLINGEPTTDPDAYYAVRNGRWFLAMKLLYYTGAAVGAGYLAARIAGSAELNHGMAVSDISCPPAPSTPRRS